MIKSMTGFGRCEVTDAQRRLTVEMKAVNHRYCDINIKMPRQFGAFEAELRTLLKRYIARGKVDVYITCETFESDQGILRYNEHLAADYMDAFRKMSEQFGIENDIRVSHLMRCPEVLVLSDARVDEDALFAELSDVVEEACRQFVASREEEGARLLSDLIEKLDTLDGLVDFVEARWPAVVEEYQNRLYKKVSELLAGSAAVDESRILTEVAIYADKICVDEEMVRLRSHIRSMRDALRSGSDVGRKLDFIAQEMNREANTTLSKSADLSLSDAAIGMKTGIEKIREQIQNIE